MSCLLVSDCNSPCMFGSVFLDARFFATPPFGGTAAAADPAADPETALPLRDDLVVRPMWWDRGLHTAKQVSKLCRVQIGCRDTCVQPVRRAKPRRATRGTARFRAPCLERGRPFKAREAVQQHNRAQPAHAL